MARTIKFKTISSILITTLILQISACGYILHPERRGKNKGENLDFAIVALDGIGLLFFIIPGIIAFAVDITSNTIYLPAKGSKRFSAINSDNLAIKVDEKLNNEIIKKVVKENTGFDIKIDDKTLVIGQNANQKYASLRAN